MIASGLAWSPQKLGPAHNPLLAEPPSRTRGRWTDGADSHIDRTVVAAAGWATRQAAVDAASRATVAADGAAEISALELLLLEFGLLLLSFVDWVPFVGGVVPAVAIHANRVFRHSPAFALRVVIAGSVFDIFAAVTPLVEHESVSTHDVVCWWYAFNNRGWSSQKIDASLYPTSPSKTKIKKRKNAEGTLVLVVMIRPIWGLLRFSNSRSLGQAVG